MGHSARDKDFLKRVLEDLSSTPYGQMVLLLEHKGVFQALQSDAPPPELPPGKGAWHLLTPTLQAVLRDQYGAPHRLSALTLWLRFARIHRDILLAQARKPLSALRPIRALLEPKETPADYVDLNLRAWGISERQARKVWSTRGVRRKPVPRRDQVLYRAASENFSVLRQLARERRRIYIPRRGRIDEQAVIDAYLEREKGGMARAVAIAALAKHFACSSRRIRQILEKRNL